MLANLENNFNSKKIIIIVSIIIIIIVIALLSILLIVHNSNKKRNDLEVSSSKEIVQNVGKRKSVAVNKEENYENETYDSRSTFASG